MEWRRQCLILHVEENTSYPQRIKEGSLQEDPDALKAKLEGFMKEHGVQYTYSTTTKFANFINRTLD